MRPDSIHAPTPGIARTSLTIASLTGIMCVCSLLPSIITMLLDGPSLLPDANFGLNKLKVRLDILSNVPTKNGRYQT